MQAVNKSLLQRWTQVSTAAFPQRAFAITYNDLAREDGKLRKKLNVLKMFTKDKDFNYEPPEMIYDRKTGDVQILPKKIKKRNTIIQNMDDLTKERAALLKEMGIKDGNLDNVDLTKDMEATAEKLHKADAKLFDDLDFDPSKFYVFSRDLFRVDVGLMI